MDNTLIAILSVVSLLIMAGIFMFYHFRLLRADIISSWSEILIKLRKRLDKIPSLVETVRNNIDGEQVLIRDLIDLREKSWPMEKLGKELVQNELFITEKIHNVWGLVKHNEKLKDDIAFMALKTEFKEIGDEIDVMSHAYNDKVRKYNKSVGFIILKPFLSLMGFKKMRIFEFEP